MEQTSAAASQEEPWRILRILAEFIDSFDALSRVGPAVTVFGSARTRSSHPDYKTAATVSEMLARRGFAVITGGGPGIMEAANRGATRGGGKSIGLNIELPNEQEGNRFATKQINFHYFFSRKVCLVKYSTGFIYMPGGFGTLDEFFEVITLVQTRKLQGFPLILMGKSYWKGLFRWMKVEMEGRGLISPGDMDIVTLTDDPEEAVEVIERYVSKSGTEALRYQAFS